MKTLLKPLTLLLFILSACSSPSVSSSSEESISSNVSEISSIVEESSEAPEYKDNPINEPYIARQYYLNNIGDIYSVWNHYRGKGVTIAVVDMGFKPDHEDFYYKDGTSKVSDLSASFTTTNGTTSKSVGKSNVVNLGESHGSFCAGVAAAGLNGKGVVGIAPEATLLLLKTDRKPKSICEAFKYASDVGAKVITVSIGSYSDYEGDLVNDGSDLTKVFDDAVEYCNKNGTVVISAGGNGGEGGKPTKPTYPAAAKNVIGVGGLAANSTGDIWEGSSYNPSKSNQFCDLFAPANLMFGCCHYDNKKYDSGWNGTSFASPIVAGAAALYFEKYPEAKPAQFENALYGSCQEMTSIVPSYRAGIGRLDIGKLMEIEVEEIVEVKANYSGSTLYAYLWGETKDNTSWPGQKLTKKDGYYTINVNTKDYHSLIFNTGSSNTSWQTVNLGVTSFARGNKYNLNSLVSDIQKIGSYEKSN